MIATVIFAADRETSRAATMRFIHHLRAHDDADAWHVLGSALLRLGDRVGAFAAFRNALRLDGTHANAQLALGNLLFDAGQCERALRCFGMLER